MSENKNIKEISKDQEEEITGGWLALTTFKIKVGSHEETYEIPTPSGHKTKIKTVDDYKYFTESEDLYNQIGITFVHNYVGADKYFNNGVKISKKKAQNLLREYLNKTHGA